MMLLSAPLISSRSSATSAARASPVWRRERRAEVRPSTLEVADLTREVIALMFVLYSLAAVFFSAAVVVLVMEAAVESVTH
jgi:hypothetical protein